MVYRTYIVKFANLNRNKCCVSMRLKISNEECVLGLEYQCVGPILQSKNFMLNGIVLMDYGFLLPFAGFSF